MSKVKIQGNASGTGVVTLTAPNTNTDRTITLPDGDISLGVGIDDNATSTAITIDASENVEINTGNLVIGTSGKGIDFSADGNAGGMTSEVLDDYEEGTWTPALRGSVTAGNTTYNNQYGFYEKIGRTVHFRGRLHVSSQGTLDGLVYVTGLPFTSNSASTSGCSCVYFGHAESLAITASETLTGTVDTNDTEFLIRIWNAAGGTSNFDDSELTDGAQLYFSGTYFV